MTTLFVPAVDLEPWPTLGPQVADFIEDYLVFGPGDLLGQSARLDPEKRALLWRLYEVFPPGHPQAGRRRFKRAALSLPKGLAKTEFAAWITAVELHHEGPVRCDGFDASGQPVGRPMVDPYIPMMTYTKEQTDDLVYAALKAILEMSKLADDFDIGLERILRADGHGKAVGLAGSPDARDGARTTFQVFDETHRLNMPRQKQAHRTMLANVPKRFLADAWSLETTTAYQPGEGSVAEDTMEYAHAVAAGKIDEPRLFFFHRQASDEHDLSTRDGRRAAVIEARGPAAEWSDVENIVELWDDPKADRAFLERVQLNRATKAAGQAFDVERWKALADPHPVPDGELITIGFDGSRWHDATAIVCTHVKTGYQWLHGLWERPYRTKAEAANDDTRWEVPEHEVDVSMDDAFRRWRVWRLYADPPYWETMIAVWSGRYGHERVIEWWTNRERPMAFAVRSYETAIKLGDLSHDGSADFERHIGNAYRRAVKTRDDQGEPLFILQKERDDSERKMDGGMAGCLSWEARTDALAAGVPTEVEESVYATRGIRVIGG